MNLRKGGKRQLCSITSTVRLFYFLELFKLLRKFVSKEPLVTEVPAAKRGLSTSLLGLEMWNCLDGKGPMSA
jgi:hypothetical protein